MKGDAIQIRPQRVIGDQQQPKAAGGSARGVQEGREEGWRWKASVRPVLVTEAPPASSSSRQRVQAASQPC